MKVLVTGATGYIGGRLVPRLLAEGHEVRVLARNPESIRSRPWGEEVEIHTGDLGDPATLRGLGDDVELAYYLVHSMEGGTDFARRDREAVDHFIAACPGVKLVVYLGGLLPPAGTATATSDHLSSRAEVGERLRGSLPTTEIRAGPIIGSGSASFEMVRYMTERFPAMVTPLWIRNAVQPIAVRDVLEYLMAAGRAREALGVLEVGADAITFEEMMRGYARVRGLRRYILPLPILAPALAARWVGWVTPISSRLAIPLVKGLVHPVLADRTRAEACFPEIRPMPYHEAVELALQRIREGAITTRWSGTAREGETYRFEDREGLLREIRTRDTSLPPERLFHAFSSLGGDRGWLVWGWAWRVRGLLDQMVGGPGLRRGRRHPVELQVGEAVDFWRVEAVARPHLLRLRAEMRVPGRAWLEWQALPHGRGSRLVQTATFAPSGLGGVLYWYLLYPIHKVIFSQMVDALLEEARETPDPFQATETIGWDT